MKAVGLHPDVFVVTSRFWQTTCTLVKSGEEAFCVDSPVLPDELELLPAIAQQASFRVVGCLATHADWDHLLGRYAFADGAARGGGVQRRAAAQRAGRGAARAARVRRGALRRAPRPADAARRRRRCRCRGTARVGERELELHPAEGHTPTGWRSGSRGRRCSSCGDYVSPVEIPWISPGGSVSAYLATLARLEPLVERGRVRRAGARGAVVDSERAWRCCARTAPTWRRCWSGGGRRRCRLRGGTAR